MGPKQSVLYSFPNCSYDIGRSPASLGERGQGSMPAFPMLRTAMIAAGLTLVAGHVSASETGADADEPRQHHKEKHLRVELLAGAGFGNVRLSTGESINTYGPGLGLRVGYRFSFGGFIALRYDHFFGSSTEYAWSGVARTRYQASASFPAVDLGYELLLPHAFVRPHVALGAGFLRRNVECKIADGSFSSVGQQHCDQVQRAEARGESWGVAVVPGLTMGLRAGRFHFLVEPRYYVRSDANAFAIEGGIGCVF